MGRLEELEDKIELLKAETKALKAAVNVISEKQSLLDKTYLTTEETANLLGLSPRTIRKYNQQGKLKGRQYTQRGMLYFLTAEVIAFQEKNLKNSAYFGE